jgi:hypothetical protein
MTPSAVIDALDRALVISGSPITLRCPPSTDVECRAMVRGYASNELVDGITQQDSMVIISPTPINSAGWPGLVASDNRDIRIPNKNRGDIVIINGRHRKVQAGVGVYMGDTLVRIEMQVR